MVRYHQPKLNPKRLVKEHIREYYIVLTQPPNYQSEAGWRNEGKQPGYIQANKFCFLHSYQLKAIRALQWIMSDGRDRYSVRDSYPNR